MLLPVVWFIGVLLFASYSGWQWYGLRQRVATATRVAENIYESDRVASPFVMGLLRQKSICRWDWREQRGTMLCCMSKAISGGAIYGGRPSLRLL